MANEEYHRVTPPPSQSAAHDQYNPSHIHASSFSTSLTTQSMQDPKSSNRQHLSNLQNDAYESTQYQKARQPINEAVTSAIGANEASAAAIPPEVLNQLTSQITANVMQKLRASNLPVPLDSVFPPPPAPMDNVSSHDGSPPVDRAAVYTPPSPSRGSEEAAQTHSSPPTSSKATHFTDPRAQSPFSQGSHTDDSDAREERGKRPKGPKRISTGGDVTIVERVWGALFNEQNQPTPRLGQFLRGIAVHLIEDYEPKHSLVITPAKMQRYYQETKLEREIYPWQIVFDDRTSSISRMFRGIEAEHHLTQEHLDQRPDIPGLTPRGFETWVTLLLQAYPDQEFDRLTKTALDMPISNPDDRKERFPKEISRRLFPKNGDDSVAAKLQKSLVAHCNVVIPSRNNNSIPTSEMGHTTHRRPTDVGPNSPHKTSHQQSFDRHGPGVTAVTSRESPPPGYSRGERHRQPYSNPPSDVAVEDEEDFDDTPTPQPIERERKPYVALPGGGKNYSSTENPPTDENSAPGFDVKIARTNTNSSSIRPEEYLKSRPTPIAIHQQPPPQSMDPPDGRRHRSNSVYKDQTRSGRNRSPSISKDGGVYRHSATDTTFGSYHSATSNENTDDFRKYRDYEAHRERLAGDRYDAARMAAYDPRDRERDTRPRIQSVAGGLDASRGPYGNEEEYYRGMSASYPTGRDGGYGPYPSGPHHPPNAYREVR